MNMPIRLRTLMTAGFIVFLLLMHTGTVEGQKPTRISVTVTGQTLSAGLNNVTVTATNSYSTSTLYAWSTIYDVDLSVQMPSPLQMLGDNHWHYESIAYQQSVTATFQVYAPTAAIGNSYQGSVVIIYRQPGDTSYTQESRTVTFSVRAGTNIVMSVTVRDQTLTAGFNNNVTVTATNSYYSPAGPYASVTIYDVDLTVQMPSPLQMLGDNHWRYDLIAPQQSVAAKFQVYAPTAAIGNSYQGSVVLTYRQLGDISYTQESHTFTFSVRGWINFVIYDVRVTPATASPGGNATVTGNLLNNGNVAAYNANVTVQSEAQATAASLYLGQVDPNISRPFSLLTSFKRNLAEGNYTLVIKVTAVDISRPSSPFSVQRTSRIQIKKPVTQPQQERRPTAGPLDLILGILRYLYELFFGSVSLAARVWLRVSGLGSYSFAQGILG